MNQSGGGGEDEDEDDEKDLDSDRGKLRWSLLYFTGFTACAVGFPLLIDGGTSDWEEADFLNSFSFVIETLGVIGDELGEKFPRFGCPAS